MERELGQLDLYSILGVERTAPSGAIHEAFMTELPRHTPSKDPEGFKALRLAYETLMDPHVREAYDALMSCGEEIAGLMNNAIAAMIQGRLRLAEELFMSVAKQTNDAAQALMLLVEGRSAAHARFSNG